MATHLVGAAGINQDDPHVTDDNRGVDHVALVVLVGKLYRPEQDIHPVADSGSARPTLSAHRQRHQELAGRAGARFYVS